MQVATASQFFISYTIRTFGALTFATIMTTRQVVIRKLLILLRHGNLIIHSSVFLHNIVFFSGVLVGKHSAVVRVVRSSSQLGTNDWFCKFPIPQPFLHLLNMEFQKKFFVFQVIVFVTLYAKSFMRNKPRNLPLEQDPENGGSSSTSKENPWFCLKSNTYLDFNISLSIFSLGQRHYPYIYI